MCVLEITLNLILTLFHLHSDSVYMGAGSVCFLAMNVSPKNCQKKEDLVARKRPQTSPIISN